MTLLWLSIAAGGSKVAPLKRDDCNIFHLPCCSTWVWRTLGWSMWHIEPSLSWYIIHRQESYYYSQKIFDHFWLVETTHRIHHNQLLFTIWEKKLRHNVSKEQRVADYWTVTRKKKLGTKFKFTVTIIVQNC